jgi:hypothetical protein
MQFVEGDFRGKKITEKMNQYLLSEYEKGILDILAEIIANDLLQNLGLYEGEINVQHS